MILFSSLSQFDVKNESGVIFKIPIISLPLASKRFPFRLSENITRLIVFLKVYKVASFYGDQTILIMRTELQFNEVVNSCRATFFKKTMDYGTSWRVYRTISVADQIYIKARRIRNIQEKKTQKIGDDIRSEFQGILNYAVIGLIQLELGGEEVEMLSINEVKELYDAQVNRAKQLMADKNHDYGEAWRNMSQQSFVDLILMKLQRMRQILSNKGKTLMSEGLDANYYDMINYAVFALIIMNEPN